jgi:hypothetical protein
MGFGCYQKSPSLFGRAFLIYTAIVTKATVAREMGVRTWVVRYLLRRVG